jgi:hypothetical protein
MDDCEQLPVPCVRSNPVPPTRYKILGFAERFAQRHDEDVDLNRRLNERHSGSGRLSVSAGERPACWPEVTPGCGSTELPPGDLLICEQEVTDPAGHGPDGAPPRWVVLWR